MKKRRVTVFLGTDMHQYNVYAWVVNDSGALLLYERIEVEGNCTNLILTSAFSQREWESCQEEMER